ncbi:MAG: serine/threonine protein kinase [Chloroflexi bacterium]|nr:serine/threonine protein kinase [Chloroflexota bacterium]
MNRPFRSWPTALVTEIGRILNRVAPALDAAHSRGAIHRDLKPSNILFDQWGEPYLADFGIVKLTESTIATVSQYSLGTPAYMSPEQIEGKTELDGRSDVYALGVILFEMLSGKRPYEATTPMGLMMRHGNEPIPDIRGGWPICPRRIPAHHQQGHGQTARGPLPDRYISGDGCGYLVGLPAPHPPRLSTKPPGRTPPHADDLAAATYSGPHQPHPH